MSKSEKFNIEFDIANKWVDDCGDIDCWRDKLREAYMAGWEARQKLIGSKNLNLMENGLMKIDIIKLYKELLK